MLQNLSLTLKHQRRIHVRSPSYGNKACKDSNSCRNPQGYRDKNRMEEYRPGKDIQTHRVGKQESQAYSYASSEKPEEKALSQEIPGYASV